MKKRVCGKMSGRSKTVAVRGGRGMSGMGSAVRGAKTVAVRGGRGMSGMGSAVRGARTVVVRVGSEAMANFRAWFERNFVNPRAGRIGDVSYGRAGMLDDRRGDAGWYGDAYERAVVDRTASVTADEFRYVVSHPLIGMQLALGVTDLRGLRCLRRGLTQRIASLQARSYRSRYYERDNRRRRLLAAERRRISRRTTLGACPTADDFRAAYAVAATSVAARIRFGGMVHDLECYVDNGLQIDESGNILGRNGGVKKWLYDNVPELARHYKNIMRYKALAKRVRQLAEIKDPVPTGMLLPDAPEPENLAANERKDARGNKVGDAAKTHEDFYAQESIARGRKIVEEVCRRCENTLAGVFRDVERRLDKWNGDWMGWEEG